MLKIHVVVYLIGCNLQRSEMAEDKLLDSNLHTSEIVRDARELRGLIIGLQSSENRNCLRYTWYNYH